MDKRELNLNEMAQVTGGVHRTVNTGVSGLNAALRADASKGSKQIGSIPNGTVVDTIDDRLVYDPVSQRNFVQVTFNGKTGWIAASILGKGKSINPYATQRCILKASLIAHLVKNLPAMQETPV